MQIPLSSPDITSKEIELVNQVLRTPYLSMGPIIEQFERGISRLMRSKHAVAVSNGTSGLHLCIKAIGIQEGDLVITTPFSFVASANCILYERAIPVFVDIDPRTLNLDIAQLVDKVKELRHKTSKLKALLPVHVFGQPCDMDSIMEVAQQYDLVVIEDACEAIGAEYKGHKVGTFGNAAVFAFYPNKQMTTGEGGVIVTDSDEIAKLCRSMRNQGRDESGTWLQHIRLGYNYRLDELSAALGVAQLERIEELLIKRERVAGWYNARLRRIPGVQIPYISPHTTRVSWFVYVIRLAPGIDRNAVMAALEERGIPSRPYFTPIHLQPFYVQRFGYRRGDFPITEALGDTCLALPFSSVMSEGQVEYVCAQLVAVVRQQLPP